MLALIEPLLVAKIRWHLGHVVRALREQRKWTQEQLAEKSVELHPLKGQKPDRLNKATIVSVEKMDRSHGKDTYERIAGAFGLSLEGMYALIPPNLEQETQRETTAPSPATTTAGRRFRKN